MDSNIVQFILEFLASLFANKDKQSEPILTIEEKTPSIDWTDPKAKITEHFTVSDAIMLHSWNRLANESDGLTEDLKDKLIVLCKKMEEIRLLVGCPINVHCMFRSMKYNQEVVKAIPNDVHARAEAADWDALPTLTIEQAKEKIRPNLESLQIRMESGTATWIHNDVHPVGPSGREFTA